MQRRTLLHALVAGGLAPAAALADPWRDVLDTPAQPSALASRGLITGLARAGRRVVAVGQRGHVLTSDDASRTWQQAEVPVASDLVAVHFPLPDAGWAVGHDGVVLKSVDGGRRWSRVLDGRTLGEKLVAWYAANGDAKWLAEAKRIAAQGAENPFLDVWFDDALRGIVVGAFGLALRTADGGATWEPLMHVADNPKALHLYGVRRIGGALYAVGEQGLLLRQEADGRLAALPIPYQGTLFGLVGNDRGAVLAYGLRGNLVRSSDAGRSWQPKATDIGVGLVAATVDERGRFIVASQAGHVLVSRDDGASFAAANVERLLPTAALASAGPDALVLGGPRGVRTLALA